MAAILEVRHLSSGIGSLSRSYLLVQRDPTSRWTACFAGAGCSGVFGGWRFSSLPGDVARMPRRLGARGRWCTPGQARRPWAVDREGAERVDWQHGWAREARGRSTGVLGEDLHEWWRTCALCAPRASAVTSQRLAGSDTVERGGTTTRAAVVGPSTARDAKRQPRGRKRHGCRARPRARGFSSGDGHGCPANARGGEGRRGGPRRRRGGREPRGGDGTASPRFPAPREERRPRATAGGIARGPRGRSDGLRRRRRRRAPRVDFAEAGEGGGETERVALEGQRFGASRTGRPAEPRIAAERAGATRECLPDRAGRPRIRHTPADSMSGFSPTGRS